MSEGFRTKVDEYGFQFQANVGLMIMIMVNLLYDQFTTGTVRYGTVRYGTVRYGTVRYGTGRTIISGPDGHDPF